MLPRPKGLEPILPLLALLWVCLGVWLSHLSTPINPMQLLAPPSASHWLGTDLLGRDLLVRITQGTYTSLLIAASAISLDLFLGLCVGSLTLLGRRIDAALCMVLNVLQGLPSFAIAAMLSAWSGGQWWTTVLAVAALGWIPAARLVRSQLRTLSAMEHIQVLERLRVTPWRKWGRHLLPALWPALATHAALHIPKVIVLESALSFLGLGIQPPLASLGGLIQEGLQVAHRSPWGAGVTLLILWGVRALMLLLARKLQKQTARHAPLMRLPCY